jgi:hypothetical protein
MSQMVDAATGQRVMLSPRTDASCVAFPDEAGMERPTPVVGLTLTGELPGLPSAWER